MMWLASAPFRKMLSTAALASSTAAIDRT